MTGPSSEAYSTMTVPAIPAMPQLISANSSPRSSFAQIGPDQQRRLDMPDKDMHRRAEAERPADPDRAPQHPGEGLHDALQHAPVEQQRRQRADHQHHRQRAEGEDIGRCRACSRRTAIRRRRDSRRRTRCRPRSPSGSPRPRAFSSRNAAAAGGNFRNSSASAICSTTPAKTSRHATRYRSSLITQEKARIAAMPRRGRTAGR